MQAIYIYETWENALNIRQNQVKSQEIKLYSFDDSPLVIRTATQNYAPESQVNTPNTIPNYLLASLYFSILYKCKEQIVVL